MTCAENCCGEQLGELIERRTGRSAMVMGMGNISGPGMELVKYFQRRTQRDFELDLQEAA